MAGEFPRTLGLLPHLPLYPSSTALRRAWNCGNPEIEKRGMDKGEAAQAPWRSVTGSTPIQGQERPCPDPTGHCWLLISPASFFGPSGWESNLWGAGCRDPRWESRPPGGRHSLIYNISIFKPVVLNPGTVMTPRGHLAMSGEFWQLRLWGTGEFTMSL